jgi:hypothetical protein
MTVGADGSTREAYRAVLLRAVDSRAADVRARSRRAATVARWCDVVTLLVAGWLTCAPYVVGYTGTGGLDGFWSDAVGGAVLGATALVRLADPLGARVVRVAGVLVGGWLATAPFTLGYGDGSTPRATLDEVLVGALVVVASVGSLAAVTSARRSLGRGHGGG